jgi:hypothetical protein
MKKTFFKGVVATAVVAATLALSSVVAFAGTVLFDGTNSTAVIAEGVDVNPAASGDSKSTSDGTKSFSQRIKVTTEDTNYIKFSQTGDFTLDIYYRPGGSGSRNILVKGKTANDTAYTNVAEKASSTDKNNVSYATIDIESNGNTDYMITVSSEISFYYVEVEPAGGPSYPVFATASTNEVVDGGKSSEARYDAGIKKISVSSEISSTGDADNLADTTTIDGLTLYGSVSGDGTFKPMTIDAKSSKKFDGETYGNRLKTGASGKVADGNVQAAIGITVDKDSTIELLGISSNSTTRTVDIANENCEHLASDNWNGSALTKTSFAVTPGTYYLYGANGAINFYDIKVYDGVVYTQPNVTLDKSVDSNGKLLLTATVGGNFTAGEVTEFGFILAKPNATSTTTVKCTNYTVNGDDYQFIGRLSNQALKAQAYVVYTSIVDGSKVTRYSSTVVQTVE